MQSLQNPFHDGQINVASAVGAVITIVFFTLFISTAYVTYMVYFRGVTNFEDIPNVILVGDKQSVKNLQGEAVPEDSRENHQDLENQSHKEDKAEPSKKKNRRIIERDVDADQDGEDAMDNDSSRTPVKGG
jgi:hypothetical protein